MSKLKSVYLLFVYLLLSLIIIYDGLSSGSSTEYIIKSILVVLGVWLTPSFIVIYYSNKWLSACIDRKIAEDLAVILGMLMLLLTDAVVYYLSLTIGPIFLVKQGESLFEYMKPLFFVGGGVILVGIADIIYVWWKRQKGVEDERRR